MNKSVGRDSRASSLPTALELQSGDSIEVTLGSDTRPSVGVRVGWRTKQLRGGKTLGEQTQDILRGRL